MIQSSDAAASTERVGVAIDRKKGTIKPFFTSSKKISFITGLINRIKAHFYKVEKDNTPISYEEAFKIKLTEMNVIMGSIDQLLVSEHMNRQERKRFWENFYKRGEFRTEVLEAMIADKAVKPMLDKIIAENMARRKGKKQ